MSACAMQTFNNVTQAAWQSAKQAVATKYGVQITADSGTASSDGFTVHWNYDAQTEILSIQCTDSPIFIPCSVINSDIISRWPLSFLHDEALSGAKVFVATLNSLKTIFAGICQAAQAADTIISFIK